MALHLTFSNATEVLIEKLLVQIKEHFKDPFNPPKILTASDPIHKWLQLRLAESNGVILGYEKHFLERFIWEFLEPKANEKVLKADVLQQAILVELKILIQEILDKPDSEIAQTYKTVSNYLIAKDQSQKANLFLQLSKMLANLFLEYDLNRPSVYDAQGQIRVAGLDQSWFIKNELYFNHAKSNDVEVWQKDFFKRLFNKKPGLLEISEGLEEPTSYLTLPALFRLRAQQKELNFSKNQHIPTFIFSPAGMSHFHRNFLIQLSESHDLFLYQLNPCSTFWEDVNNRSQKNIIKNWQSKKNQQLKFYSNIEENNFQYQKEEWDQILFEKEDQSPFKLDNKDNVLLELWGQTGKENIALWCQAIEYDFEFIEKENTENPTVLQGVKSLLLNRQNQLENKIELDDSIRFIENPDILRECESIKENIYHLLLDDPDLKLQDIALLIPSIDEYAPTLERVFSSGTPSGYIPLVIDSKNKSSSLYAQGLQSFLKLINSNFNRPDLIQFLRNPLVQNAFNYGPHNLNIWENWIDQLKIFHGWSKSHREELEECEPSSLHTWSWGLERLALGTLSNHSICLDPDDENLRHAYLDMNVNDQSEVEKFYDLIQSLYIDIKKIKEGAHLNIDKRIEDLQIILDNYLTISENELKEKPIKTAFIKNLHHLKLQEQFALQKGLKFQLSTTDFIEQIKGGLEGSLPGKATLYTGNLSVQKYKPGSILPHKVIYLAGMNSADFPGQNQESTLNLLIQKRIIGDMNSVRQHQYLFLETLLQAKEKLILSWQSQNIIKDETLTPASTLLEFMGFLNDSVLKETLTTEKTSLVEFEGIVDLESSKSINPLARAAFKINSQQKRKLKNRNLLSLMESKTELTSIENHSTAISKTIHVHLNDIIKYIEEPLTWVIQKASKVYAGIEEKDQSKEEWERLEGDGLQDWQILDLTLQNFLKEMNIDKASSEKEEIENILSHFIELGQSPQSFLKDYWFKNNSAKIQKQMANIKNYFKQNSSPISFNKEIKELFNQGKDIIISDSKEACQYKIEGNVYFDYSTSDDEILGNVSASSLFDKKQKIKAKKIRELLIPWLLFLIKKSTNSNADLCYDLIDREKNTRVIFDSKLMDQGQAINTLNHILKGMFSYQNEDYQSYFECSLIVLFENKDLINDDFKHEDLIEIIDEKEGDAFSFPSYQRAKELKLYKNPVVDSQLWNEKIKNIYAPFFKAIEGVI